MEYTLKAIEQWQKKSFEADEMGRNKEGGGSALLSRAVAHAVPSAQRSLTTVFGMGTGVTSSLEPPPL